jgi:hypothetical protein
MAAIASMADDHDEWSFALASRTLRSLTSGENLFVVRLLMAQTVRKLQLPTSLRRFSGSRRN